MSAIMRIKFAVMGSLETLSRLATVSRQYFHCLGLGLGVLRVTALVLVSVSNVMSWSRVSSTHLSRQLGPNREIKKCRFFIRHSVS